MHHCTRVLYELYKVNVQLDKTNVLIIQGVYKVIICERFQSILTTFFFFVLSSKDCTLLRYTFLYYTLILCTLFNSHMIIWILIPLMMFERKFCFSIFHYFLNQTNENMVNLPMVTHWVGGIWNLSHYIYKVFTLSVHDKYTNCIRVYKTIICERF